MKKDNKQLRRFAKRFVNPFLRNLTRSAHGPFGLLRHVGRRSGQTFETPLMVWPVQNGFIIALTYGPQTDWLRNLQAAGQGKLFWHKQEYLLQKPAFIEKQAAWAAFPFVIRRLLQLFGTQDFVQVTGQPVS